MAFLALLFLVFAIFGVGFGSGSSSTGTRVVPYGTLP
jgi:hypothetical protein